MTTRLLQATVNRIDRSNVPKHNKVAMAKQNYGGLDVLNF